MAYDDPILSPVSVIRKHSVSDFIGYKQPYKEKENHDHNRNKL